MRKLILIIPAICICLLNGCEDLDKEFGTEGIVLTKQLMNKQISSSYFSNTIDPEESKIETIHVAGIYRTGMREDNPAVRVEIEEDRDYMEQLLIDASDPNVTDKTDEMNLVAGCKLLPTDCYEITNLQIEIPKGGLSASIEVKLDKEKLARLDAFSTWILPAFRVKSSSMRQIGDVKHSLVTINMLKYYPAMPDDRTGWVNIVQNKPISTTCPPWSQAVTHAVTWAVNGDKDNEVDTERWIPFANTTATIAPWFEIDLQGTYKIDGFQLFYCIPNTVVRENCDFWIKTTDGEWKKIAELRNNTSNSPSYQLSGEEATHIRVYWDLIKNASANYAVKLKEIEVYTNTN